MSTRTFIIAENQLQTLLDILFSARHTFYFSIHYVLMIWQERCKCVWPTCSGACHGEHRPYILLTWTRLIPTDELMHVGCISYSLFRSILKHHFQVLLQFQKSYKVYNVMDSIYLCTLEHFTTTRNQYQLRKLKVQKQQHSISLSYVYMFSLRLSRSLFLVFTRSSFSNGFYSLQQIIDEVL